jgi:hypothetical protein
VNFFKQFLNADPACNPVAYHLPFRNDDALVYISTPGTEVRAAMSGVVSKVDEHSAELSATDKAVIVHYIGLSSVTGEGKWLKCGQQIGTMDRFLQVRFAVDGKPLRPPEALRLLPRALQPPVEPPSTHSSHP